MYKYYDTIFVQLTYNIKKKYSYPLSADNHLQYLFFIHYWFYLQISTYTNFYDILNYSLLFHDSRKEEWGKEYTATCIDKIKEYIMFLLFTFEGEAANILNYENVQLLCPSMRI